MLKDKKRKDNGAKVSGDEVPKKLKQNINTVHILTLMMAFHDGTSHDVATKAGDYNTLMNGQFSLATNLSSLLAYSNKSPRLILI